MDSTKVTLHDREKKVQELLTKEVRLRERTGFDQSRGSLGPHKNYFPVDKSPEWTQHTKVKSNQQSPYLALGEPK